MIKKFLTLCVVGLLTYNMPSMPVKVVSNTKNTVTMSNSDNTKTVGLISKCSLSIVDSNKAIKLLGKTESNTVMKSIGYKDISIERSSDNIHWSEEKPIDDLLKSDSSSYYLNNYSVSVKGGYYYRVTLTHYAKESGLFGSSQSVSNTSNSVWVS